MKKAMIGLLFIMAALLISCESIKESLASLSKDSETGSSSAKEKRGNSDAENWDIEALDTAKDADYLTGIEKDIVLEMNKVRSDPKKYAELYITPKLKYFNGKNYSQAGNIIVTQEGKKAVDDCIAALSKTKSVPLLTPELGLSLAAKDHVIDQSKTGQTGHNGSDKSTPFTRINRYGQGYTTAGENLAYGGTSGRDIVTQLLIDDGVPSRGHRTNIMNKGFTQTGVASGTHPQFRTMCAITYAAGYASNKPAATEKNDAKIPQTASSNNNPSAKTPAEAADTKKNAGKTDAERIADAIERGDCAALYAYTQQTNPDPKLIAQANTALKRYTVLDSGVGKYKTGKMDQKVRKVPKELTDKVFSDPAGTLPAVVSFLASGVPDPFLKAKILHDWICDNIAYDADMYFSGRTANQDYVSVLKKKKAVCAGYSELFRKMCELAEVECVVIEGYSKGFGYTGKIGKDTDHAWNAVKIGGKWYLVDVTWDSGPLELKTFIKRYSTGWLFVDSRPFLYSHLPEKEAYQFYAPVLTAGDFMREAYISGVFFQYGLALKTEKPEYNNLINGEFSFDITVKNPTVSLSSALRTPQQRDKDAASWQDRKGGTITFNFDTPDTSDYKGYIFAKWQNEENLQERIDIGTFERVWLTGAEKLLSDKKITQKELDYFRNSYFKVADNNSYYFQEDQFDAPRNSAVSKIHKLLELPAGWMETVLDFTLKAAPGYKGFGNNLKYPFTFSSYNDVPNTQLLSPITGTLKAGSSQTFSISSKDYTGFAIIINKQWNYFTKNSKTGNFELSLEIPSGLDSITISGAKGNSYWGLVQYKVAP